MMMMYELLYICTNYCIPGLNKNRILDFHVWFQSYFGFSRVVSIVFWIFTCGFNRILDFHMWFQSYFVFSHLVLFLFAIIASCVNISHL